jgi:hypothetical protein
MVFGVAVAWTLAANHADRGGWFVFACVVSFLAAAGFFRRLFRI